MPRKPAMHALQLLTSQRWAIRREALERMVAIAERDLSTVLASEDDADGSERLEKLIKRRALFASPATAHPQSERLGVRDGVAILPIVGPLCRYASWIQEVCGLTSYQLAAEDFQIAIADPSIKAILLHLDSPGGEVNGCSELASLIQAHRGVKPIVAMVSDGAASAAYWIAAAADEIVVTQAAYVGSIGVYFEIVDWSEREKMEGMRRFQIVSSQSPNKVPDPKDAAGMAVLQREASEFADAFIVQAADGRGMTPDALIAAGDGGAVFIGRHAVERGLADRVSTTEAVLAELAARDFTPSTTARATRAARVAATSQESQMPPTPKPPKATIKPRALAAGDEVKSLVARETAVAEGAAAPAADVRENVSVARIETADGDSGWLIVGEECEVAAAAAPAEGDEGTAGGGDGEEEPAAAEPVFGEVTYSVIETAGQLAQHFPALVAQIRQRAVKGERDRIAALAALDPRQITAPLLASITNGETPGKAARALLAASRAPGAAALAAMATAEQSLTPPAPMPTGADAAPSAAKTITKLLEEHGDGGRARRASRN
jgi:ClpP class serine protease